MTIVNDVKPPKKKTGKALWTKCYPDQAKALRPENDKFRGGIKSRSTPTEIKMACYRAIRALYLSKNPKCRLCSDNATQIHHQRGRDGWLLVNVLYYVGLCAHCHKSVHDHPELARTINMLPAKGQWNKVI